MTQTKLGSFVEAWGNVAIGFSINFCANWLFLPMVGVKRLTAGQNFVFGLIMTVISVCRSYAIRRWFNGLSFGHKEVKGAEELVMGKEKEVGIPERTGGEGGGWTCGYGHPVSVRVTETFLLKDAEKGPLYSVWCHECRATRQVYTGLQSTQRGLDRGQREVDEPGPYQAHPGCSV